MIVCKARGKIGTQVKIEGKLDDLINEVSAALYGVVNGIAKKVGKKEAAKSYWAIVESVGSRLADDGILDGDDEDEDDGVVVPPDIFKNFMNGGDLLF